MTVVRVIVLVARLGNRNIVVTARLVTLTRVSRLCIHKCSNLSVLKLIVTHMMIKLALLLALVLIIQSHFVLLHQGNSN